jgi:hypothetical protein
VIRSDDGSHSNTRDAGNGEVSALVDGKSIPSSNSRLHIALLSVISSHFHRQMLNCAGPRSFFSIHPIPIRIHLPSSLFVAWDRDLTSSQEYRLVCLLPACCPSLKLKAYSLGADRSVFLVSFR